MQAHAGAVLWLCVQDLVLQPLLILMSTYASSPSEPMFWGVTGQALALLLQSAYPSVVL